MKSAFAVVLTISMAVVWAGGCQEEQASSGDKMARLAAVESRDLQSQLQTEKKKKDDDIKNLNTQFQAEMKKKDDEIKKLSVQLEKAQALTEQLKKVQALTQAEVTKRDEEIKELVDQCQTDLKQRDDALRITREQLGQCAQTRNDKLQEEADKQCKESISAMTDWNSELKDEVDRLKAELAKIKEQK